MLKGKQAMETSFTQANTNNKSKSDFTAFAGYSGKDSFSNCNEWISDSGATSHTCSNLDLYAFLNEETRDHSVILPDGSQQKVTHVGEVILSSKLRLQNVFQFNLLSMGRLVEDSNISVVFETGCCYL